MQNLFIFAKLPDEFFDAIFVKKCFLLRRVDTLVRKRDFQAGIEKRQLAQTRSQAFELKFRGNCEDRRIGQKSDERTGGLFVFDLADDSEFVSRFPFGESHVIDLAVTRYFGLEPFRERVRAFRAHAMQTTRILISALPKFSAGM